MACPGGRFRAERALRRSCWGAGGGGAGGAGRSSAPSARGTPPRPDPTRRWATGLAPGAAGTSGVDVFTIN